MDCKTYTDILYERYKRYFDVYRDYTVLDHTLDIFAEYKAKNERYFLSKNTVIYRFENFEYCLVKCFTDPINETHLKEFTDFLVDSTHHIVKPNDEHMSTYLTGVMVSQNGFSQEVKDKAGRFKYSKNFLFTLKGWCDVRLILVDLEGNEIISNKKGKEVKDNYTVAQ